MRTQKQRPVTETPGAIEDGVVRDGSASTKTSEQTLALISDAELTARYGVVTIDAFGLDITRPLAWDECKVVGFTLGRKCFALARKYRGYQLAIGDLGHHVFCRYGEGKAMAAELCPDYSPGTVKNWRSIAGRVEKSRRRDVCLTILAIVAPLEPAEQDYWQDIAFTEKLTTRELEQKIAEEKIKRARERELTEEERLWRNDECARSDLYELEDAMQVLCAKSANTEPDALKRLLSAPGNALLRRSFCRVLNETDTAVRSLRELAEPKSKMIREDKREAA
jgi:hypothetical protein